VRILVDLVGAPAVRGRGQVGRHGEHLDGGIFGQGRSVELAEAVAGRGGAAAERAADGGLRGG
jgi:hypothetical protein